MSTYHPTSPTSRLSDATSLNIDWDNSPVSPHVPMGIRSPGAAAGSGDEVSASPRSRGGASPSVRSPAAEKGAVSPPVSPRVRLLSERSLQQRVARARADERCDSFNKTTERMKAALRQASHSHPPGYAQQGFRASLRRWRANILRDVETSAPAAYRCPHVSTRPNQFE